MTTEAELDELGWAQYGDRYWQRDDGEVAILLTPSGYHVHLTHRRYRRYAHEEIASGIATLRKAIEAAAVVGVDPERAAGQRAYLTAARARDRTPAT